MICGVLWGGQFGTLLQHKSSTFSDGDSGCDFRAAVVSRWRPDDGQARVRVLFRTRLLRVVTMIQYAQPHAFSIARRIQLPAAFPPPCPPGASPGPLFGSPGLPLDPFWVPLDPFWVPLGIPWIPFWDPLDPFWAPLGTSWAPLGPHWTPGRKRDPKSRFVGRPFVPEPHYLQHIIGVPKSSGPPK